MFFCSMLEQFVYNNMNTKYNILFFYSCSLDKSQLRKKCCKLYRLILS